MKILVTGAAGFIGMHVVERLIEEGHQILAIDNINDYYSTKLKIDRLKHIGITSKNNQYYSSQQANCSFKRVDLTEREETFELFEEFQPEYVCHLAGQPGVRYSITNPMAYIDANIVAFSNVLEGARRVHVKHFVYASSSSVYGKNNKVPYSELDRTDQPASLYAATKKANELIAYTYSSIYKLACSGLRFFTVYGPWGRPDMAPYLFLDAILKGKEIKVFNHGDLSRDFTFIDDIVTGILKIIPTPSCEEIPSKVFNIGHSSPVNLMDFINTIEEVACKKAIKNYVDMQPGDVYCTFADTTSIEKEFRYKPSTNLKEGIKAFYDWFIAYHYEK